VEARQAWQAEAQAQIAPTRAVGHLTAARSPSLGPWMSWFVGRVG
jgi:hypothetical protein